MDNLHLEPLASDLNERAGELNAQALSLRSLSEAIRTLSKLPGQIESAANHAKLLDFEDIHRNAVTDAMGDAIQRLTNVRDHLVRQGTRTPAPPAAGLREVNGIGE